MAEDVGACKTATLAGLRDKAVNLADDTSQFPQ